MAGTADPQHGQRKSHRVMDFLHNPSSYLTYLVFGAKQKSPSHPWVEVIESGPESLLDN